MIDPEIQELIERLHSHQTENRDNAIATLYRVDPAKLGAEVLAQLQAAYEKETDFFLKAGLGRLIKLRQLG